MKHTDLSKCSNHSGLSGLYKVYVLYVGVRNLLGDSRVTSGVLLSSHPHYHVYSCVACRHALLLVDGAGPLVGMFVAPQSQINLILLQAICTIVYHVEVIIILSFSLPSFLVCETEAVVVTYMCTQFTYVQMYYTLYVDDSKVVVCWCTLYVTLR